MGLVKVSLGDYVITHKEQCGIPNLHPEEVSGINRDKTFFEPSTQVGSDTSKYQIVPPGYFACNLMHVGRDVVVPLAYNQTSENKHVSPAYTVFKFRQNNEIDPLYFLILMSSREKDRYCWFHTDASVRDGMSWSDFCDLELNLPPIETQRKYVAIYESMLANQKCYEKALDDLELVCRATIERFRKKYDLLPIGNFIHPVNEKNTDGEITLEQGVNIQKEFITPQRSNSNLSGRKVVRTNQFCYCTQLNNENVAIAQRKGPDCIVSSVYDVFEVIDTSVLDPDYLMLWLVRDEFGRFVYWASEGSAYEFLNYDNLAGYRIPVPDISTQTAIADIYRVYKHRKKILATTKRLLNDVCPILIKGSIDEAKRS